jgi:hypothetical protein
MYDTFNFTLNHKYFDYRHIKEIFEKKMHFKQDTTYPNGRALIVNYENYAFSLSEKNLKATGSLTKWYGGNNVQNINYSQVQEALMKFETLFEIPFDNATVHRIDVAFNSFMTYPVPMYLDLIITPVGYKKTIRDTSKLFEGTKQDLYFYDKVANSGTRDAMVYAKHKNDHIFRFEVRFVNGLAKKLSLKDSTFKNFYNPNTYELLLNKWYQGYKHVPKLTIAKPLNYNVTSLTSIRDSIISEHIQLIGGMDILRNKIYRSRPQKNVKYLVKQYLDTLPQNEALSPKLQLELDSKIDGLFNNEIYYLTSLQQISV